MKIANRNIFTTIKTEGGLIPSDLLEKLSVSDKSLEGLSLESYHLNPNERINEAVSRSWNRLISAWHSFRTASENLPESDRGTTITRERWLLILFQELGYGRLETAKLLELQGKQYPISHFWKNSPIHLVGFRIDIDKRTAGVAGAAKTSPHSLVQEFLNSSQQFLWGFVSNGLQLRILRDNKSLTRQAYVEFDLEAMMEGEVYSDFVILWLLCHQSRVESDKSQECWLERWSQLAQDQGTRALDNLRDGVENTIKVLGSGFLAHTANTTLRGKLRSGVLSTQDYYRQLLRFVYRLIFLFVAEDRNVLFIPEAQNETIALYNNYYSVSRLRRLAEKMRGTKHGDLYHGLRLVMKKLNNGHGCSELGLPVLGSFLWSAEAMPDLIECEISNELLLEAIRSLTFIIEGKVLRAVDYRNLGSEELGSVYESLLELHPELHIETSTFELKTVVGHERKTTGSYYTHSSLISCLLDSALEPVAEQALKKENPEKALLNLKICDPACGSGHFLIAAAHRLAKRIASVRTGDDEPSPEAVRKALRDVIGHCIYGVDINPMSVELCKVALWMDALEPGKPLSFLDHKIQCGNSLLGTTPKLIKDGIPDSAFEPIEGDDKKYCQQFKKRNKEERQGQKTLFDGALKPWEQLGNLATALSNLDEISDDTIDGIRQKQQRYESFVRSSGYLFGRFLADTWCSAFVWKKVESENLPYPITEEIFRKIERNPHTAPPWMKEEVHRIANQYQFFHWHLVFPDVFRIPSPSEEFNKTTGWAGGFDLILGNPPWERVKLQEKEWFADVYPEIANATSAAIRKRMIENLKDEFPDLYTAFKDDLRKAEGESILLRDSGRFPLCGKGDVNTYAVFAELAFKLINPCGRCGVILPLGIVTDDTTKSFFQEVVSNKQLVSVVGFINERMLFPAVLHNFKFCILVLTGENNGTDKPDFVFNCFDLIEFQDRQRHFSLTKEEIKLLNPNTETCAVFFWSRSAEICKEIYRRVPILESEESGSLWNIKLLSMFHMSNDSDNFIRTSEQNTYCLYEAKMMNQYNHRYSSYGLLENDERSHMLPVVPETLLRDPNYKVDSYFYVPKDEVTNRLPNYWQYSWLIGFRGIASAGLIRTIAYCFLPICGAGNSLPIIILPENLVQYSPCLVAGMNSFVLDFVARQKIAGPNLNFFIKKQLAVLPPNDYQNNCEWQLDIKRYQWVQSRVLELSYSSNDMSGFARDFGCNTPPFIWNENRRFLLKAELDAGYFHFYKVSRDNVDYILETFTLVKQNDISEHGEYLTKKMILEIYDEMAEAMRTGKPYQTRLDPPPADPRVAHSIRQAAKKYVG